MLKFQMHEEQCSIRFLPCHTTDVHTLIPLHPHVSSVGDVKYILLKIVRLACGRHIDFATTCLLHFYLRKRISRMIFDNLKRACIILFHLFVLVEMAVKIATLIATAHALKLRRNMSCPPAHLLQLCCIMDH